MHAEYRQWLERQDYQQGTVATKLSQASRIEEYYGDLDEHYGGDRLAGLIELLRYSKADQHENRPNPSSIPFDGDIYNNLASYRDAARRYRDFRDDDQPIEPPKQFTGDPRDTSILDTQLIEIVGRNRLVNELLSAGLEVALPLRDRGVDLIANVDIGKTITSFVSRPMQIKAASKRSFGIFRKYEKVWNLLVVYLWHLDDPAQAVTYALTHQEAVAIGETLGWTKTASCAAHHRQALPAEPSTVALYITDLVEHRKTSTMQRRLSAISQAHQAVDLPSPTGDAHVRKVAAGIRRTHDTHQQSKQAAVTEDVRAMVATLPETPTGERDRALLLLGFAGAFRRSELVSLEVADVRRTRDGLVVTLRRGKTDQEGVGRDIGIPYGDVSPNPRKFRQPLEGYG